MLLVWEIFGEMILLYNIDTQLHQYFAKIREDQNGMMTTSLKNILIERILNLSFWNKVNHKTTPKTIIDSMTITLKHLKLHLYVKIKMISNSCLGIFLLRCRSYLYLCDPKICFAPISISGGRESIFSFYEWWTSLITIIQSTCWTHLHKFSEDNILTEYLTLQIN